MAELRHSTAAAAARASNSPVKRDSAASAASSPFASTSAARGRDDDDDDGKDAHRSSPLLPQHHHHKQLLPSPLRSLLALENPRAPTASLSYRILLAVLALLLFAALFSAPSLWSRFNAPYLCQKEGITLHCPQTKEPLSLWENPRAATTSWKPCAERRSDEPSGKSFVSHYIFDVDHFINYLKDDVRIIRDIPDWFTEKDELFTSIKRTVKNIPKYASAQFYIDNVLPRIKEKTIMSIKPFVDRLGYDNVPMEINRLRCRVNYHALKFLSDIEEMSDKLATKMRNRTGNGNPYMALHLRYEKGMVGLSFCDFAGTREEKAMMAAYRQKEWPRRYKNGSHLWPLALQKRKEGRCPLEPGEIAVILRAMGYPRETQIYVASGQVYGGKNRMAPLRNMFPNLVTKEELASAAEMEHFRKHVTSLAALDFLVCLKSDVFVQTHGGNFAKLIIGARRYSGRHRLKSIKPDKGLMSRSLGDPYLGWASFAEDVVISHQARAGLP
ncbi:hypothetical protein ACQ4PT_030123 [Festuca glaucescens]